MALYQNTSDVKMRSEIMRKFLGMLPLKNEPEEAQNVHRMLLKEILNKNEFLLKVVDGEGVKKMIEGIKSIENNNPELEILDDEGKRLLKQIVI